MSGPEVSVVMGVFNGAPVLPATLDSVLSQDGVDLELVVVDDGSTDASGAVLAARAARDRRLRVLAQPHAGLTRALIRGCAEARGEFVARQDAGDESLPGRLRARRELLASDAGLALVGCGWELLGPEGELLEAHAGEERAAASAALRTDDPGALRNPCHGSVMFRRDVYERVRGYRAAFEVGQDVDLWVRMARVGDLAYVMRSLYRVRFSLDGVSARKAAAQRAVRPLVVASARAAARGESDAAVLREAESLGAGRREQGPRARARARAAAAYFVGAMLARRGDARSERYLREAVRLDPLHAKGWLRLARAAAARRLAVAREG